jgi:hypothetical protein
MINNTSTDEAHYIHEYLASQYGRTWATLDFVFRPDIAVKPEAENPVDGHATLDQDMTVRAPHTV